MLQELTGGDAEDIRGLLRDFLDSTDEDLHELEALRSAGDLAGLTRQAHKIKGAARLVGAIELEVAAAALEAAGRSGEWSHVLPMTVDMHTASERLRLLVAQRYPG